MAQAVTTLGLKPKKSSVGSSRQRPAQSIADSGSPLNNFLVGLGNLAIDTARSEFQQNQRTEQQTNEILIGDAVARNAAKFPNNGAQIKEGVDSWWKGFSADVPDGPLRKRYRAFLDASANKAIADANKNVKNIDRQNAITTEGIFQGNDLALWRNANAGLQSDDEGVRAASRQDVAFQDAMFIERVAGLQALADPEGTIARSIANMIAARRDEGLISEAVGWYKNQPDDEKATAAYFIREGGLKKVIPKKGVKAGKELTADDMTEVNIMDSMSIGAQDKVRALIDDDVTFFSKMEATADQEIDTNRTFSQLEQASVQIELLNEAKANNGGTLTIEDQDYFREQLSLLRQATVINPGQWDAIDRDIGRPLPEFTDPDTARDIYSIIDAGGDATQAINSSSQAGRLAWKDEALLRRQNRHGIDTREGKAETKDAGRTRTLLNALRDEIAVSVGTVQTPANKAASVRLANNAMLEFEAAANDPDRTETVDQIYERMRDQAVSSAPAKMRESMRAPYGSSKPNAKISPADVLTSSRALVIDEERMPLSKTVVNNERKTILGWIDLFDAKERAEFDAQVAADKVVSDARKEKERLAARSELEILGLDKLADSEEAQILKRSFQNIADFYGGD